MNVNVVIAVFKRNFKAYFSIPLGYVFICAFVLLSGIAAFWPNDFFNNNLASLDQLNKHLPWIMLIFIPAITMSIWADERRQGTDELILTLPCTDFDIVMGKFFAVLAIFTVALVFSLSNIVVLMSLGEPDLGLLVCNYIGYWFVGAAMLAIGMVASFLTNSLTVGFILGMAMNAPLVFAESADAIIRWDPAARFVKGMSIENQFLDLGRGLLTLSAAVYFCSIVLVSLYVSMILIGRRHWAGGSRGQSLSIHFTTRTISLIAIAVGANIVVSRYNIRFDATEERTNSPSPESLALIQSLNNPRPVYIEAYVSPNVPEEHVQTRLNLVNMLREVDARAGDKVVARLHDTERFSENELEASQQFGITPRPVQSAARGRVAIDEIMMGAAVSSGLEKVVVPFFDPGISVEYELIRSITTASQQSRKRVGVLMTDAKVIGAFDTVTMTNRPDQLIVAELEKQYDVVEVYADTPITEEFDVLLAVQPSSLSPEGMEYFIDAVLDGQPTAIFEDPFPFLDTRIPATSQPRQPVRRNPFSRPPPPLPKGDISKLWDTLGIQFTDREIIWQDYNPYPKLAEIPREFVFIGEGSGAAQPFNLENPITSGLQQLLLVFPGALESIPGSSLKFVPLLQTSNSTGVVPFDNILLRDFLGQTSLNTKRRQDSTGKSYILAGHISGFLDEDSNIETEEENLNHTADSRPNVNVVVVPDIDMMFSVFFAMRARGTNPNEPVDLNVDNVTFVLNVLDYLAGDDRFVEIRKRRPTYRTLTSVESRIDEAKSSANVEREKFIREFEDQLTEEQQRLNERLEELQTREGVDSLQMIQEVQMIQKDGQKRIQAINERLQRVRDLQLEKIERELTLEVRSIQDRYKLSAIALPPIPPLLVAAAVYWRRRTMEQIGVSNARLK